MKTKDGISTQSDIIIYDNRYPTFESQMVIVTDFCRAWTTLIIIEHRGQKMVMISYEYYMDYLCTQDEGAQIEKEL